MSIINTRREMRIDCVSYASWKPLNYLHMLFGQQGTLIRSPSLKCTGKGRGVWGWVDLLNKFELRWANSDVLPQLYNLPAVVMWQSTLEIHLRRQIKRFLSIWQQASWLLDLGKFTFNPPTSTYLPNCVGWKCLGKIWILPVKCWNILMEYCWWGGGLAQRVN